MKKKYLKYVVIGTIILVSTVAIYLVKSTSGNSQVKSSIETTTIDDSSQKIYINGIIQPIENKNIYLEASKGKVDTVLVTNGQAVNAGDVLFTYKNDTITSQIEEINEKISTYQTQKERLESKKNNSNKKLTEKKNNLSNLKNRNETEILSIQSLESEIQALETEISSYNDQINTIEDNINEANKKVENLKSHETIEVKADIAGVVSIIGSKDDFTNAFLSISSSDLYIKGTVNEKDVKKLEKDQKADVLVIADNSTRKAKVDEVSKKPTANISVNSANGGSMGSSSNSLSNYDVTLLLDSQENVLAGYHVQATIFEGKKGINLQKKAIVTENNETFVYKVENNVLKKQKVEYEEVDNENVNILSGLENGDKVVTNPTENTKEGIKYE